MSNQIEIILANRTALIRVIIIGLIVMNVNLPIARYHLKKRLMRWMR